MRCEGHSGGDGSGRDGTLVTNMGLNLELSILKAMMVRVLPFRERR